MHCGAQAVKSDQLHQHRRYFAYHWSPPSTGSYPACCKKWGLICCFRYSIAIFSVRKFQPSEADPLPDIPSNQIIETADHFVKGILQYANLIIYTSYCLVRSPGWKFWISREKSVSLFRFFLVNDIHRTIQQSALIAVIIIQVITRIFNSS